VTILVFSSIFCEMHCGVLLAWPHRIVCPIPDRVKTKTYKSGICCFYANNEALRNKSISGWLGIRIMCQSEAACLLQTVVSTSSAITILFSVLPCTKWQLSLYRQNVNCSRHDIAEKLLNYSLTYSFECSLYEIRYIYFFLFWGL
jgi:hypothetical protein